MGCSVLMASIGQRLCSRSGLCAMECMLLSCETLIYILNLLSSASQYFDENMKAPKDRYEDDKLQPINSGFQVLFDVIILAIPAKVIWRTKFNRRDKGAY